MKINKLIIITVLTTVLMSVNAFAETVRAIKLNLTYDGKTVEYREKEVKVFVDGEQLENLDMPAVIIDGRTLVPLRAIFEKMGAKVKWDPDLKMITAETEDKNIVMFIDNKAGVVNGNAFNMDVAPKIINDRTMVPVRAIAEAIGASVLWDDETRTVRVETYVIGGESGEDTDVNNNENNGETSENTDVSEPDSQKVTDLSHVDTSEIDSSASGNTKNEVSVTAVNINGNDS